MNPQKKGFDTMDLIQKNHEFNFLAQMFITTNVNSFNTIVLKIYESQTHLTKENGRTHCDPTPKLL
jgi:hypothetical protein